MHLRTTLHQEKNKGLPDSGSRGRKMNIHISLQYNQKQWWEEITTRFHNWIMSRTVSVHENLQTKTWNKHMGSLFLGPFFCPLGHFRNRHYVFSRCEIMNTGNIDGQIMPWSACSVGIRSVPIRNFPWSCTLKTKQKTFTVTKLARWKYCDLKESIPLMFTWLETLFSNRTANTIILDLEICSGWMKFLPSSLIIGAV